MLNNVHHFQPNIYLHKTYLSINKASKLNAYQAHHTKEGIVTYQSKNQQT